MNTSHVLKELPVNMPQSRSLVRPSNGTVIAGVCAGLADRFGLGRNTVRFLFVLSCLLPGPQFVIYIVLWIIMPKSGY